MRLNEFCQAARRFKKPIKAYSSPEGYSLYLEGSDDEPLRLDTDKGDLRTFKSLDSVYRTLSRHHFEGEVLFQVTQQGSLV